MQKRATKRARNSATSVGAAGLAGASARCLLRLTHSPRFRLWLMTHWVTTRIVPRPHGTVKERKNVPPIPQPQSAQRALLALQPAACFGKESRAHRGRNSRLAHRARQDSLRSLSASQDNPLGYRFLRSSGKAKKPDRLIRLFCTARAETLLLEKRYAIIAE